MRPILPFMAALILFGTVACGASASNSGSGSGSSAKSPAPPTGTALDAQVCKAISSYPVSTTAQGQAFATFLTKEAALATLNSTMVTQMTTLSKDLAANSLTSTKVKGDATALHATCASYPG
jgi:hypothetical protein